MNSLFCFIQCCDHCFCSNRSPLIIDTDYPCNVRLLIQKGKSNKTIFIYVSCEIMSNINELQYLLSQIKQNCRNKVHV